MPRACLHSLEFTTFTPENRAFVTQTIPLSRHPELAEGSMVFCKQANRSFAQLWMTAAVCGLFTVNCSLASLRTGSGRCPRAFPSHLAIGPDDESAHRLSAPAQHAH
jgi:hypothetical protein